MIFRASQAAISSFSCLILHPIARWKNIQSTHVNIIYYTDLSILRQQHLLALPVRINLSLFLKSDQVIVLSISLTRNRSLEPVLAQLLTIHTGRLNNEILDVSTHL